MKNRLFQLIVCAAVLVFALLICGNVAAQEIVMSKEDMMAFTAEWKGERFSDGRPKVPDSILERMKLVEIEEAWGTLHEKGYTQQFEGNWKPTHLDPGGVLVGRALTTRFMPKRPDIDELLTEKGHKDGHIGGRNSWPIDMLVPHDVYVADAYGSVIGGPIIGGNLGTAIFSNSKNGVVFDGSIRDLAQLEKIDGFNGFVRDFHPSYNWNNMMVSINRPTRIGHVTVLPGDVVLAKREGVIFIPPQFAEEVCKRSELVRLRDLFGFRRIKEGVYTPGQVDQRWSDTMERDFSKWLNDHLDELPVPKEQIQELLKDRSW